MIKAFENLELWWITGAQLLYGGETVKIVDGHSQEMVDGLNKSGIIPIKVVYKGTANSDKEVASIMMAANNEEKCVGVITWMHTDCRCCTNLCSTCTHNTTRRFLGTRWTWTS